MSLLKFGFQNCIKRGLIFSNYSKETSGFKVLLSPYNVTTGINRNNQRLISFTIPKPKWSFRTAVVTTGVGAVSIIAVMEYLDYKRKHQRSYTDQLEWDGITREMRTRKDIPIGGESIPKSKLNSIQINRHVPGPTKLPGLTLTLFQYQTCPFCCKVRAFMDYFGIPYNVVEVNPVLRKQIKFSNYRKVPILVIDNEKEEDLLQLNDSSLIVSILTTYLLFNESYKDSLKQILDLYQNITYSFPRKDEVKQVINKYFVMVGDHIKPEEFKAVEDRLSEERKWRQWADSNLVHQLSPNVYRTLGEAIDSFKYFSRVGKWEEYFPHWERLLVVYVGAFAMYLVGKRLKRKHNLKDDVRESLYDACRQWTKALGKDRLFMGGNKPNLADLSVFGVLHSIEGCSAFKDLLKHTNIGTWYFAVKEMCEHNTGGQSLKLTNA